MLDGEGVERGEGEEGEDDEEGREGGGVMSSDAEVDDESSDVDRLDSRGSRWILVERSPKLVRELMPDLNRPRRSMLVVWKKAAKRRKLESKVSFVFFPFDPNSLYLPPACLLPVPPPPPDHLLRLSSSTPPLSPSWAHSCATRRKRSVGSTSWPRRLKPSLTRSEVRRVSH